jgi:hypothetical protein
MFSYWTMSRDSNFLFFLNLCDLWCFKSLVRIYPRLIVRFSCFFNHFESCCVLMHLINLLLMLIVWHFIRTGLTLIILDLVWAWLALVLWTFVKILLVLVVGDFLRAWAFLWTRFKLRVAWIEK